MVVSCLGELRTDQTRRSLSYARHNAQGWRSGLSGGRFHWPMGISLAAYSGVVDPAEFAKALRLTTTTRTPRRSSVVVLSCGASEGRETHHVIMLCPASSQGRCLRRLASHFPLNTDDASIRSWLPKHSVNQTKTTTMATTKVPLRDVPSSMALFEDLLRKRPSFATVF
jgi:hypothetical protein